MANHKSAIKRIKSDKEKMLRNKYQHKSARTAIQKLRETSNKKRCSRFVDICEFNARQISKEEYHS